MRENYREANRILGAVWAMSSLERSKIDESVVPSFMETIRTHLVPKARPRTISALRAVENFDNLRHIVTRNGTAEATVVARSQEWLEENGKLWVCICLAILIAFLTFTICRRVLPRSHLCQGEYDSTSWARCFLEEIFEKGRAGDFSPCNHS